MRKEQVAPWHRMAAFAGLAGAGQEKGLGRAVEMGRAEHEERSKEGTDLEKVL